MSFEVMFVCTGNICRSPMGERLFAARVNPRLSIVTTSSGTHGLDGWQMDGPSARALREIGGDPEHHSARHINVAMIEAAHLILTAEEQHREYVVGSLHAAAPKTFTMREFAQYGAKLDPARQATTAEDLLARVAAVEEVRALSAPLPPGLLNIGDPYGARYHHVRACADLISDTVDRVVKVLGAA